MNMLLPGGGEFVILTVTPCVSRGRREDAELPPIFCSMTLIFLFLAYMIPYFPSLVLLSVTTLLS